MARSAGLELRLRSLLDADTKGWSVIRGVSYTTLCLAAIPCLALSLLRLTVASANDAHSQALAAIGAAVMPWNAITRRLPGGAIVSLVQMSRADAKDARHDHKTQRSYWQPDATRLAKRVSSDRAWADLLDADIKRLALGKSVPAFGRIYRYDPLESTFDLVVAANLPESSQQRILLSDKKDQLLSTNEVSSVPGKNYIWKTLRASHPIEERAAYAVVETRPYSFVTIDNVPLAPKDTLK